MVSGIVHATPSFVTLALVIPLATYRVLARSASGCVQPAAGVPVAAGAVPVTAAPRLDGHARALGPLLPLLEQPTAISPAATTSAALAATGPRGDDPPGRSRWLRHRIGRAAPRAGTVLASLLMTHHTGTAATAGTGVEPPTAPRSGQCPPRGVKVSW